MSNKNENEIGIKIKLCESDTDLYHQYPGQNHCQPSQVRLDIRGREIYAAWDGEIGNAVPMSVWYRHELRFLIPPLRMESANALIHMLVPYMEELIPEYSNSWDGSNYRAVYSQRGEEIIDEIDYFISTGSWDEEEIYSPECDDDDDDDDDDDEIE